MEYGERFFIVDLLARKNYAVPECVSVEIRVQTHSKCVTSKDVHKDSYLESLHT